MTLRKMAPGVGTLSAKIGLHVAGPHVGTAARSAYEFATSLEFRQ